MEIQGNTRLIGLIGNPVEHTLSPVIHNGISKAVGIDSVYMPMKVTEQGLSKAIDGAYELNILGLNVTVPHKNAVMNQLVEIDDAALAIGAVNTLVRLEEKHGYKGYNTDMLGLRRQIIEDGIVLKNQVVVILGAGGAAKAVAYMCLLEEAKKVYILNRTIEKAQDIADTLDKKSDNNTEFIPLPLSDYTHIEEENLIVFQSTSIGLAPHTDEVVIEDAAFYKKVVVGVDLIYNPANTKFMQLVEQYGGKAYNALKMLLYQAVIAYELWHDIKIPQDVIDDIYVALKRKVYPKKNIVLVGYMGSGKTTFGTALAKELGMEFVDADAYIVSKTGKSIPDIFAQDGEEAFRKIETDILKEFNETLSDTVLATGGGMPLRKENARLLKEIGTVLYLMASPKEIYDRVKGDTNRPLLQCENPYQKICDMIKQRHPIYSQCADEIVDTNCNDLQWIVSVMKEKGMNGE
ncbi:MAG: shikimate dehydrogenase [Lachnospiraceae bacterium]|nr:shikimate dehydrogenase [Lachnospiraceae bacterium]